jgi:hypothetical protein
MAGNDRPTERPKPKRAFENRASSVPIPPAVRGRRATPSRRHAPSHRSSAPQPVAGFHCRQGFPPDQKPGSGGRPWSSPPVTATASSHGPARIPSCDLHALTAMPIASTASASGDPAGRAGVSDASIACAHDRAERPIASAWRVNARSPAAHSPRWAAEPRRDRAVPSPLGLGQQRSADHLRAIAAARHRPRGQQHVRRLARPTVRSPRP